MVMTQARHSKYLGIKGMSTSLMRNLLKLVVRLSGTALVVVFVSLATSTPKAAANQEPKRVLVVLPEDLRFASVDAINQILRSSLRNSSKVLVETFVEQLDEQRIPLNLYEKEYVAFLQRKYANQKIDLVIPVGAASLEFVLRNRSNLFPEMPVVFLTPDQRDLPQFSLGPNVTGVCGERNFKPTLELALKILPNTKKVFVTAGVSEADVFWTEVARKELKDLESRVEINYLIGLPMAELKRRISSLPSDSIILHITYWKDGDGKIRTEPETFAEIDSVPNAPIFVTTELQLLGGSIGGSLVSTEIVGHRTADLALRVLAGEMSANAPVQVAPSAVIFDWRQLQRWRISENRLPPGSILRNRDLSFWEHYKWYVLGVLALAIAEALLIAILLVQRERGARAEKALRERLEFEKMLSELSANFVNLPVEEIDKTINRHLREVVKVIGVEGCSVFEFSRDDEEVAVTHRYDVTGRVAPFSVIKFEQFPWYLNELHSGAVVKLRDINADLPEEAVAERKAASEVGIKSLLIVPITIGQNVTSAISVFTTQSYRDWPVGLEKRLRLVGEIFVQAMLRKRTEEALRASEARVRRLVDSNIIGVIHSDAAGNVIDANNAFLEMIGYTREELDAGNVHWDDMTPAEYLELDKHGMEEAKARGACTPYEKEYLRKDGGRIAVLLGYALLDVTKEDYICFVVDLTQNKLGEAALRESEDRYRDLVEHSHELICTHSLDGQILSVNPWAAQVLGYEPDSLIGKNIREGVPPDYREAVTEYLQAISREGFAKGLMQVRTATGDRRIWEYHNTLRTEGVETPIVRGMAHDITEKKLAERALRDSQSRVSGIVNSAMDAIITVDANERVVLFNAAAEKMFRCSADQAIGQPIEQLIPARFREDHSANIREFGETGVTSRAMAGARAISGLRSDGEEFPLEASISQTDVGGQKLFTVIMRDITKRKRAEQELRDALAEVQRLTDQLQQENIYLKSEIELEHNFHEIIGHSDEIKYTMFKIEQVAATDSTVLILGETGTGKELVARAIHSNGPRKDRPLVKINCAALPANLIESELFGHERGAFTGAHARKLGRFEVANGATLFLDEVGELPLDLQAKLLRVLQDGEFERLGSSNTIKVDVRIIAATNRNLKAEIQKGLFREDLWFRLSVFPITVPALRQRKDDIPTLVNYFVDKFNRKLGKAISSISPSTNSALQSYSWPGNVRELANVIERAVISSKGLTLQLGDKLEDEDAPKQNSEVSAKSLVEVERDHIFQILNVTGWKIEGPQGAAKILGMNASTLRTRMIKLGIQRPNRSRVSSDG